MKLHENKDEFRAAVTQAAAGLKLPEHVVEKDYWVTKILYNLSQYEFKKYVIFKGGTSLSKGHKLISRFSEDIDLALHPEGVSKGKIHKREGEALHKVVTAIKDQEFKDDTEGKESEKKRYKRVYTFPQNFDYPSDSQIHGKIVLEVNSFTTPTPTEQVEISSLVSEHLKKAQGQSVLQELNLMPFDIEALTPERTFCEKLLALRRSSHKGGEFFEARIRHVYDIHQLYRSKRITNWLRKPEQFFELLSMCYEDDVLNQKISEEVAPNFRSFDVFFEPIKKIETVRSSYESLKDITFDNLVPEISDVSSSLNEINSILIDFTFSEG